MMKSSRIIVFTLAMLMVASCSNVSDNIEKMIPSDALGVMSINMSELLKKSGVNDDGRIIIPDVVKTIVEENDASTFSTLMSDLPYLGLDTDGKAFAFFSNKTFGTVLLVPLDDEEAACKTIARRTGSDFAQVEQINCLYHEDNLYVVKDKVLMIGTVNKAMDVNKAAQAARNILTQQRKSIFENEHIKETLHADDDINAYLLQDGLKLILKKSKIYREIAQKLPLVEIFTQSDIKAYECHIMFEHDRANITTHIIADDNSDYNKLLHTTLAQADASFLKAIPNSMDYIISMSVKGDSFVKLQQIQQLIKMFNNIPFIGNIDLQGILSSIDGPIAVGVARDPHLAGEWNAVIAAKTTNPQMIVNQISSFASSMGQAPEIYDGEYVYQYENKMIKIGVVDRVLYLKMLDYEQTEGYAYELENVRGVFESSNIGFYVNPQVVQGGTFTFGMSDNINGSGRFVPSDPKTHSAQALLKVLCSVKPKQPYDDMIDEDEEDYTSTIGNAIDQLKPVE